MYNRVVVPLDGSDLAEGALPEAVELARVAGARLHLLRVIDTSWLVRYGLYGLAVEAAADAIWREEKAVAGAYIDEMRRHLAPTGIPVTGEVRQGRAAEEIGAAIHAGDLIVMATHNRTGVKRFALGSIAEDVVRHATVPVLLSRAAKSGRAQPAESSQRGAVAAANGRT